MANSTQKPVPPALTKKHLAKMQRENLWRRYLIIGTVVVIALIVGVILYGLVFQTLVQAGQPVATIDNQKVTTRQFQNRARFQRANLLNNAFQTYQFAQSFNDPSFQSSFASQMQQIKAQLETTALGREVVDTMVEDVVIEMEAKKRGIQVTDEEVRGSFEEVFGYYPKGTPTSEPTLAPLATSTLSALQLTLIPPTATPQPTAVITATEVITPTAVPPTPTATSFPTQTAVPTATPDTVEGSDFYTQAIENFSTNYSVPENEFRATLNEILKAQLYRQRLRESVLAELNLSRTEPQVWARHILVADETLAKEIYERLQKGEDFCALAAEFSTDTSNKDRCGDLNWFPKGQMVMEFEQAAFALKVGEISQPVKSSFGYHIIQSLGNEERPLSDSVYQNLQDTKFQEWLDARKAEHQISILEDRWPSRVPAEPPWPAAFDQFISQIQQPVPQPTVILETTPTP